MNTVSQLQSALEIVEPILDRFEGTTQKELLNPNMDADDIVSAVNYLRAINDLKTRLKGQLNITKAKQSKQS
jgi:hypothetical protein